MKRIRVFGLVCVLASASAATAQEAAPVQEEAPPSAAPKPPGAMAPPAEPTTRQKRVSYEERQRLRALEQAHEEQQRSRALEQANPGETLHERDARLRQLYYSADVHPVRVLYDPVRCKEYERTGGPIAGTVVGGVMIGAGAGIAAASNGDKALLGVGIAAAVVGLAVSAASGSILAKRKKARYEQALAGCPVNAK